MDFYSMEADERAAFAERVIAEKRTPREIWQRLKPAVTHGWSNRAAAAAELLAGQEAVVDLGCGGMDLEAALPTAVGYFPVDLVRRDERTTIADLNTAPPPLLPAPAVACLGLLEYLYDIRVLLRALASHYPVAVVSYNYADAPHGIANRRSNMWVSDYTRAQMEELFLECGYRVREVRLVTQPNQMLWKLLSAISSGSLKVVQP